MKNRKAIIETFGTPEVIKVVVEDILVPKKGEIRVKIEASTVSATDIFIRKGIYPLLKQKPPFTLGFDFVGFVDTVTEECNELKVGDRVCGFMMTGGNSDFICVNPNDLSLVPLELDLQEAACLSLSGITAFQMFKHFANIKEGDRILIHGGSGAIGDTLLQLGKLYKCEMVATASEKKHEIIRSYNAIPIDYHSPDYFQELLMCSFDGFDAIFDFTNQQRFNTDMILLKKNGTLVTYGVFSSALKIQKKAFLNYLNFLYDFGLMMFKLKYWSKFSERNAVFFGSSDSKKEFPQRYKQDMQELSALVIARKIKPLVHKIFGLEDVAVAHQMLQNGEVQGQIVIINK